MPRYLSTRVSLAAFAVFCAVVFEGCASWQRPRIDPTGEQLLVWPNEATPVPVGAPIPVGPPVPVPAAAPAGPAVIAPPLPNAPIVTPPPALPAAPLPFGNVQAPPVYSETSIAPTAPAPTILPAPPVVPASPGVAPPPTFVPGAVAPSLPAATVVPAVPIVAGAGPAAVTVPCGREHLRLTPDRLVAPVGSEILLRAGVGGADGQLVSNERIEWTVARNTVGQFTEMGIRDTSQLLGWWEAPQKVDEWSAVGRTAFVPVSLNVGTENPADDVQINRGETWVTLTSACEGTSLVTARAPGICEFNQATTAVYWIDAQWIFPASVCVPTGQPHTLTTTVMRRTDGAPLAGWIVRYNVGGGASLGYEGGNSTDVPTDASGRASVEVSPAEAGGGVTNVGITIIRPESVGPSALPRVELGRSAAAITWAAAGVPAAAPSLPGPPVAPVPAPSAMPSTPAPFLPPTMPPPMSQPAPAPSVAPPASVTQPSPYSPPPASQPTGKPRLEIALRATSAEQVPVGEYVSYDLTITNRGDGVARNIKVHDRFDQGLRNPGDTRNLHVIENSNVRELAPNDSQKLALTFQVVEPGQQCHDVTVSADGAETATARGCATGIQAAALEVKVSGPRRSTVGDMVDFSIGIRNTGATPAANVELRIQYPAEIEPVPESGAQRLPDGSVLIRLDRELTATERRVLRVRGQCRGPSNNACVRVNATAKGGANSYDQACVEILQPMSSPPPGVGGTP